MKMSTVNSYIIDEAKEIDLFANSLIFWDTSALLDFYYFSDNSRKEIFQKLFPALKDRLWITAQTEYEFLKNREKVYLKPIATYDNLRSKSKEQKDGGHLDEIDSLIKKLCVNVGEEIKGQLNTLREKTSKSDKHPYLENIDFDAFQTNLNTLENHIHEFQSIYNAFKDSINVVIEKQKESHKATFADDMVLKEFQQNLSVTRSSTYSEILQIVKEGELRYNNLIPPGYLDEDDKIGFQKFGDLILWKQIIRQSKEEKKDIILVINDMKEDWWYYSDEQKAICPRHELIKELHDNAGFNFWMYDITTFLYKSKKFIVNTIQDEVISDVKSVTKPAYIIDSDRVYKWISSYFKGDFGAVGFNGSHMNGEIDYTCFTDEGERIGFIHKYISSPMYTRLYHPLKIAYEYSKIAQTELGYINIFLIIEVKSREDGTLISKHFSKKNPRYIMYASKGNLRVILVTKEKESYVTLFDSENSSDNIDDGSSRIPLL